MFVIGLDAGSTTTKGVKMQDGQIQKTSLVLTKGDPKGAMQTILKELDAQISDLIVTTGYGRKLYDAAKSVTEITCHGRGAEFLSPGVKNVIDIGGQDSKTILLDGSGSVLDFRMNDKCAAGTGRFVEVLMHTLGEDINELDTFISGATPVKINSMCTVFAESEVVSLVGKGEKKNDIALGVLRSIASRISGQLAQLSPGTGDIFFSGGLSQSTIMQQLLAEFTGRKIVTHPLAQYAGAIGASVSGMRQKK